MIYLNAIVFVIYSINTNIDLSPGSTRMCCQNTKAKVSDLFPYYVIHKIKKTDMYDVEIRDISNLSQKNLATLSKFNIRKLSVHSIKYKKHFDIIQKHFKKAKSISISLDSYANKKTMESMPRLENVTNFDCSGFKFKSDRLTDADLVHLKKLPNLEKISLRFITIKGTCFKELEVLKKLKHLDLCFSNFESSSLKYLQSFSKLEHLCLGGTRIDKISPVQFKNNPNLKELYISDISGTNFKFVIHLNNIRVLSMTYCSVGDDLATYLKGKDSLRELHVSNTKITDRFIRGIANAKSLEDLNIRDCSGVTDKSVEVILKMKKLDWMELDGTSISEKNKKRIDLWLGRNKGIRGKQRIQNSLSRVYSQAGREVFFLNSSEKGSGCAGIKPVWNRE